MMLWVEKKWFRPSGWAGRSPTYVRDRGVHAGILPERKPISIPNSQTGFSFRAALNKLGLIRAALGPD